MKNIVYIAIYFAFLILFALVIMVISSKSAFQVNAADCDQAECESRGCYQGSNVCIDGEVRNWWYCWSCVWPGWCLPIQPEEDLRYHSCSLLPGCCPAPTATPTLTPPPGATPTPTPPVGGCTPGEYDERCTRSACDAGTTDCASEVWQCNEYGEWEYKYPQCNPSLCGSDCGSVITPTPPEPPKDIMRFKTELKVSKNFSWQNPGQATWSTSVTAEPGETVWFKVKAINEDGQNDQFGLKDKFNSPQSVEVTPQNMGGNKWNNSDHNQGIYLDDDPYSGRYDPNLPGLRVRVDYSEWGGFGYGQSSEAVFGVVLSSGAQSFKDQAYLEDDELYNPNQVGYWADRQFTNPDDPPQQVVVDVGDCNPSYVWCGYNFKFYSNLVSVNVVAPATIQGNLYVDKDADGCQGASETTNPTFDGTLRIRAVFNSGTGGETATCDVLAGSYSCTVKAPSSPDIASYNLNISNYDPYSGRSCKDNPPGCLGSCSNISVSSDQTKTRNIGFKSVGWFQAQGGDVHAGDDIRSKIPATAVDNNFSQDLDSYPGVVSTAGTAGFGQGQVSSRGWLAQSGFNLSSYNYNYFYQKLGSPTTDNFNGNLGQITADGTYYSADDVTIGNNWNFPSNRKAVILIAGKLEINKKINVPQGSFLAFMVKGDIEIKGVVGDKSSTPNNHLEGVFLTDGVIKTNSDNDQSGKRLVGAGIFIAQGGFDLGRDLKETGESGGVENSTTPAELFLFRPDLVVNSPRELWVSKMSWLEVAP